MKSATLQAKGGIGVDLLNYGATIQAIRVPAAEGAVNVVLGYENPGDYLADPFYLGCALGRFAGRIEGGQFWLDGTQYQLERNDADHGHSLHSGSSGFSKIFWEQTRRDDVSVTYAYRSPHGEGGFPGNLETQICYSLASPMALRVDFEAVSDADTVLNLSNHSYFNLSGGGCTIEDHEVWINSDLYLPMADNMLPTGDVRHVADTEFDFRHLRTVADALASGGPQLELAGGIDHFFLLNHTNEFPPLSASLKSPRTGIRMQMFTSQPGVQFYAGNSLQQPFMPREGLCLEFQGAPNAPNNHALPSAFLKSGEPYRHQIIYQFDRP